MAEPFWSDEQDLTDAEQERFDPDSDFEADNPDGAAASIEAAADLTFSQDTEALLRDRAQAIQERNDDADIPNRFEDDVYVNEERAYQAIKAVASRGWGAGQGSRGVKSNFRWGIARVDEFGGWVSQGEPDDSDYTQDADLLPFGHEDRSVEDAPDGLGDEPFVDGMPNGDQREQLDAFVEERL